jgi:hypothetical protein
MGRLLRRRHTDAASLVEEGILATGKTSPTPVVSLNARLRGMEPGDLPASYLTPCTKKIGGKRMPLAAIGIDFNRILLSA